MSNSKNINLSWSQEDLNRLSKENNMHLRGLRSSRLDTFVDTAFAFALTLLVISFDEIPATVDELLLAMKRIPAFLISFFLVMTFWFNHRTWSRFYGLETRLSLFASLGIIFVVMVYVYPLKIMSGSMLSYFTNGYVGSEFHVQSLQDIRIIFILYSSGYLVMAALMVLLFLDAHQHREHLSLDKKERVLTLEYLCIWLFSVVVATLSIILTLIISDPFIAASGYVYFLLFPLGLMANKIATIIVNRFNED